MLKFEIKGLKKMKNYRVWIITVFSLAFTLSIAFFFDKIDFLKHAQPSPVKFLLGTSTIAGLFIFNLIYRIRLALQERRVELLEQIYDAPLSGKLIVSAVITFLVQLLLTFWGIFLPSKVVNVATMLCAAYSASIFLLYSLKPNIPEK